MKDKTYKEQETEKRHGKKRFIERQVQDDEALKEIVDFLEGKEDSDYDTRTSLPKVDYS